MICHGLGLTFLFVGFARDFMVFMTEISFRISFYQPKCLSTNISMSAVIIILNKVIYIRTYLKPLEIINLGRDHPWSGVRTLDRPNCKGLILAEEHQGRVPILWSKLILGIFKPFSPRTAKSNLVRVLNELRRPIIRNTEKPSTKSRVFRIGIKSSFCFGNGWRRHD